MWIHYKFRYKISKRENIRANRRSDGRARWSTTGPGCIATGVRKWTLLKIISKILAMPNSHSSVHNITRKIGENILLTIIIEKSDRRNSWSKVSGRHAHGFGNAVKDIHERTSAGTNVSPRRHCKTTQYGRLMRIKTPLTTRPSLVMLMEMEKYWPVRSGRFVFSALPSKFLFIKKCNAAFESGLTAR